MKVYKTNKWDNKIVEKEVERVTENSIFWTSETGRKNRELKLTNYGRWHDSKDQALEYLHERILTNLEANAKEREKLEFYLKEIKIQKQKQC